MKGQKGKLAEFVRRDPPPKPALSLEERMRRADAAMEAATEPAPTLFTETPVTRTPVREDVEPPSETPVSTGTPVHQTPVRQTRVRETGGTEIPVESWMWLNTPAVLNWALDDFLPSFDHNAQSVMLRLLRLTLGFRRRNCLVSTGTIALKTKLSEATVTRVVRALKDDRYVETRAVIDGRRKARGLEFILTDRALPPASLAAATGVTRTPVKGTGVGQTSMKDLKIKSEREAPAAIAPADIGSILRTEAKKFREFYPAATDDVVRAKLRACMRRASAGLVRYEV